MLHITTDASSDVQSAPSPRSGQGPRAGWCTTQVTAPVSRFLTFVLCSHQEYYLIYIVMALAALLYVVVVYILSADNKARAQLLKKLQNKNS